MGGGRAPIRDELWWDPASAFVLDNLQLSWLSCVSMKKIRVRASLCQTTIAAVAFALLPGFSSIIPDAAAASPSLTYMSASAAPGKTTRYWDCAKPSASWPDKAPVTSPVKSCAKDGVTAVSPTALSGDQGGTSFMCTSLQPWVVDAKFSYGFAAAKLVGKSESETNCACYALQFTSGPVTGQTFVAQVISAGGDLGENHFDLLTPGGGVGLFNACQSQWGAPSDGWGARYGGVATAAQCLQLPKQLQPGCNWRFSWLKNADNPSVSFRRVRCPDEIVSKSGCRRKDDL